MCPSWEPSPPGEALTSQERQEAIRRANVWSATDIPSVDLKAGPDATGAFAANEWVTCEYTEKKQQSGHSPKFVCETSPGHEVKVKYGPRNAEVFGEVLSTRLVQHTDNKAANQRLLCPEGEEVGRSGCRHPVLMVSDLGLTFGHAGLLNRNADSVSLATWTQIPVWKDRARCVAALKGSFTGSFSNPTIREAGRAFLAGLLVQLTDAQLRDLFANARVTRRSSDPSSDPAKDGTPASVDEWVKAFKLKRAQIVDQRCPL